MKHLKIIYTLSSFLLFYSLKINSQINLVPNGSFDITSPCPDYPGQINYATGWNNVNLVYGNFSVGTPDLFHACGSASLGYNTVPPNTFAGTCSSNTGNGFAGTVLYNVPYPDYREYFSTKLMCQMVPGNTYTVSFWITNGSIPKSPYIIKNIGAHFSTTPLTQSGWNIISVVPQCEITNYSGSLAWVKYTFTLTASANWEYITLGSFRNDAANGAVSSYTGTSGPPSAYAMYFWDDIQVIGMGQGSSSLTLNTTVNNPLCFGSGNGSATVSTTSSLTLNYSWMPGSLTGPTANNLASGIYTITASDGGCNSKTTTLSITQPSSISVNVQPIQICQGTQGTLNSITSGGTPAYTYSWSTGSNFSGVFVTPTVTSVYTLTVTDANNCQRSITTTVTVVDCTGIETNNFDVNNSIYPNPFNDKLYIKSASEIDEIIITDLLGKVILKSKPGSGSIDTKDLSNGIYFISVVKGNKIIGNKKMIKTN